MRVGEENQLVYLPLLAAGFCCSAAAAVAAAAAAASTSVRSRLGRPTGRLGGGGAGNGTLASASATSCAVRSRCCCASAAVMRAKGSWHCMVVWRARRAGAEGAKIPDRQSGLNQQTIPVAQVWSEMEINSVLGKVWIELAYTVLH